MRGVQGDANAPPIDRLVGINNHHMQNDHRVTGNKQGAMEEDVSKINGGTECVNEHHRALIQAQAGLQEQQQQPQGSQTPLVCWERFLPFKSLKVLLVENDDSTRQVVSALLRNCSYEVTAVANGLQAWKLLEDIANHIDLVLTEVAMPYLSGIGLLSKIMNHETYSNIPVIMMSSNDSMGIVFKCFSKGAADFLVKPIRKNELKNLWQHVWRKCHSSSGSGSESGIRAQKSPKSRSVERLDNCTDSNNEDDSGSIGLNARDGSDNGSGTQNSWSKRTVEVESPKSLSPWDELANPLNSTCAQVVHSRPESLSNNWVPSASTRKYLKRDDVLANNAMGKDLKIGILNSPDSELQGQGDKVLDSATGAITETFLALDSNTGSNILEMGKVVATRKGELRNLDSGPTGATNNVTVPCKGSLANCIPSDQSKVTNIDHTVSYDPKEIPSLELSLKGHGDSGDNGVSALQQNILRRSDLSAFSRYNTTSANQAPTGNVNSCSPVDNSLDAAKTESVHTGGTPNQGSNGSSNNIDMGSTTNNALVKLEANSDKTMPKTSVTVHHCSSFQPVQEGCISSAQPLMPSKPDKTDTTLAYAKTLDQQAQVPNHHHHHHHYHHHHHHHSFDLQQQQLLNHDDSSLRNLTAVAGHSEMEGNGADYGSASGSNNGSNGQNGSSGRRVRSNDAITEGTNVMSDNRAVGKRGPGDGSGSLSGADPNRLAQREAALNKFRKKRKDRCFDKKVRYESRKKLAEQRPRFRGQFVRQVTDENKNQGDPDDTDS